jgi:hypothetical protein
MYGVGKFMQRWKEWHTDAALGVESQKIQPTSGNATVPGLKRYGTRQFQSWNFYSVNWILILP